MEESSQQSEEEEEVVGGLGMKREMEVNLFFL